MKCARVSTALLLGCHLALGLLGCPPSPRAVVCLDDVDCPAHAFCDLEQELCLGYDPALGGCGDGAIDAHLGEECDDANRADLDGCDAHCRLEPPLSCGDGAVDYLFAEQCDDGQQCEDGSPCQRNSHCRGIGAGRCDLRAGDGCSPTCQVETSAACGNTLIEFALGEQCDDGRHCADGSSCAHPNDCVGIGRGDCVARSGDGCSASCRLESHGAHCGDGVRQAHEACDDGPERRGDRCDTWGSDDVCACDPPCGCNYSCSLRAHTQLLAGQRGSSGLVDGVGAEAELGGRGGLLYVDGQLYYADQRHSCIRRITPSSGEVRTIAGDRVDGRSGYADAEQGLAARFAFSFGALATDGQMLFVADDQNHLIRSVELTPPHAVQTIAGLRYDTWNTGLDPCSSPWPEQNVCYQDSQEPLLAELGTVRGLHYDRSLLLMVDASMHTLRSLNLATGNVLTLAGAPGQAAMLDGAAELARFDQPRAVVADGAGAVYVAEPHRLSRYNLGSQTVTTLYYQGWGYRDGSGSEVAMMAPSALVFDGSSLYWTEDNMQVVRQAHLPSGVVSTLVGRPYQAGCVENYVEGFGNAARLSCPSGLAYDPRDGALYVVDSGNELLRRIR